MDADYRRAAGLSRVGGASESGLQVRITTLDRLLGSRVPALIKIDVEGYELSVLRGAVGTLENTRVPVVFEAPDFGGGSGTTDCVALLESIGYSVFSLIPRGVQAFTPVAYSHNLLAVNRGDRTMVTDLGVPASHGIRTHNPGKGDQREHSGWHGRSWGRGRLRDQHSRRAQ